MILPTWLIGFMKFRFPIGVAMFVLGIALIWVIGGEWAWLFWLPGAFFVLTHIFIGTAATASQVLQTGDIAEAKLILSKTLNKNWLIGMFRGNYEAVRGMIAMAEGDMATAEEAMTNATQLSSGAPSQQAEMYFSVGMTQMQQQKHKEAEQNMRKASELGLPAEQESIVQLNLAAFALGRRDVASAKKHAQKCRDLKPTNAEVIKHLADVEKALKNSGQIQNTTTQMRMNNQRHINRR
jgi:tetratricopeptide (TPR) repeat protein